MELVISLQLVIPPAFPMLVKLAVTQRLCIPRMQALLLGMSLSKGLVS